jgi:hypothetical protein
MDVEEDRNGTRAWWMPPGGPAIRLTQPDGPAPDSVPDGGALT